MTVTENPLNIADRLRVSAQLAPGQRAIVFPQNRDAEGRTAYTQLTFSQLDREVDELATGLVALGIRPGHRLVLMVRPSLEFIALTFAIFRSGAVCTLIDPGMGRRHVLKCLEEVDPDGFVAIPTVHRIRRLLRSKFRNARFNITVGSAVLTGAISYRQLRERGQCSQAELPRTLRTDPAAIIFTSGSTGPPKGVLYEHGMFDAQVDLIRERYGIDPGEIDLPGFPLFSLFNLAMQVTTVIPRMDPTRPAHVDPALILEGIRDQGISQAYGSPALWNRMGQYCHQQKIRLPGIRRILSAGAPVPIHVLKRMTSLLDPHADVFTPYGATECLPVASVGGREVLDHFATLTRQGRGTCVGTAFPGVEVRIITPSEHPIPNINQTQRCAVEEIGEIIVRSPAATKQYFRRPDATAMAKIADGSSFWHRMGDMGYLDASGRIWFCGRRAHIVHTSDGPMYSVCCEAILNTHPSIYRCALVGLGERGRQVPAIVAEPEPGRFPETSAAEETLRQELLQLAGTSDLTHSIRTIVFHRSLPVDTRHNVKIDRESLAVWAARQSASP
ncbi:MAG: AMP-binding protein [Planctomycetaceae bacterium]|nr:AMP-binding protein [Planctomycetaceae bacterium]